MNCWLLSAHTRLVAHHGAGEELAGERMPVESYATVISGVVKLTKTLEDGRQQIVGLQFAPDFLGRLYAEENGVSSEAASDVHLCRVPKATMERLVKSNPLLAERLMSQTMRELDEARDWMVTLGRKTAAEKGRKLPAADRHPSRSRGPGGKPAFRPAAVTRRYRGFPRPDDRDRVAADVEAQGRRDHLDRRQPAYRRAAAGKAQGVLRFLTKDCRGRAEWMLPRWRILCRSDGFRSLT
jgi:hypothetical protein